MVTDKLIKYRENFGTFLVILSFYLFRTYRYLFPNNYQQDDVSELKVTFFDSLFCAINELGDNHPFLSISIWLSSKIFTGDSVQFIFIQQSSPSEGLTPQSLWAKYSTFGILS